MHGKQLKSMKIIYSMKQLRRKYTLKKCYVGITTITCGIISIINLLDTSHENDLNKNDNIRTVEIPGSLVIPTVVSMNIDYKIR